MHQERSLPPDKPRLKQKLNTWDLFDPRSLSSREREESKLWATFKGGCLVFARKSLKTYTWLESLVALWI